MRVDTLLREEIQSEFEGLKKMELGTEEYKTTVDGVTRLVDRVIELEKMDVDHQEKVESREIETDLKLKQMKDEKKDRVVKNVLTGLSISLPLAVTVWGTIKSLKFEEEGTVTTMIGRLFLNKLVKK